MAERELDAGELDLYDDSSLRSYVQDIADRLVRGSRLAHAPHVVIADHDGTYAAFGDRIVIGRIAIEKLGSEAELAGIVAHELVHVEGHHATVSLFGPDADAAWLAARRDAESIADERAVALLERAGYAPVAMQRALSAELEADDDEHPARADRIARVAILAGGRDQGFAGRDELLEHVDRMIVGRDTRLGVRVGNTWIVAALDIALELPDTAQTEGDELIERRGHATLTAYAVGAPWARELGDRLVERAEVETALGRVTVGIAPAHDRDDDKPVDKLEHAVRAMLPSPAPGTQVVIVDRPHGGLVIELSARVDAALREHWLSGLRLPSDDELHAAQPARIALLTATRTATVRELVAACPDPARALALDDATRVISAGSTFKCTDR